MARRRCVPKDEQRRRFQEHAAYVAARRKARGEVPRPPYSKVVALANSRGEPLPREYIVPKPIGIVGTPCGGTQWVAQRLCELGYEVGHERVLADGICDGFFLFGIRRRQAFTHYDFKLRARLIRHPLRVMQTLPRLGWARLRGPNRDHTIPWKIGTPQENALRWWVHTHEANLDEHIVVRIGQDTLDHLIARCALVTGREPKAGPYTATPKTKASRDPLMNWEQLAEVDEEYTERALHLVEDYDLEVCK